jgi:hypothetical protein
MTRLLDLPQARRGKNAARKGFQALTAENSGKPVFAHFGLKLSIIWLKNGKF